MCEPDPHDPYDDEDEDRQSCGCFIDYHSADCPRLTDRFTYDDPPEPEDYDY